MLFFCVLIGLATVWPWQVAAAGQGDPAEPAEPAKHDRLPIVDRAIEYHGGDLYRASRTRLTIRSRSGAFDVVSRMDGELFEHQVSGTNAQGQNLRTRVTNDTAERWVGGEAVELDAEAAQRARDFVSARIYFPFLPFRLNDPGVYKQDLGLETWGDRSLHKVKVTFEPGSSTDASDEYLYWFDPQTARLEQFAYSFANNPQRGGLRLRRAFNHRWVGGLLFFDSENWGLNGGGDLKVEAITPAYVRENFDKISTVVLEDIHVEPLATSETSDQPDSSEASAAARGDSLSVEDFSWFAGHWVGEKNGERVEESWLEPAAGTMVGIFRWMKPDAVRVYELLALEPTDSGVVLRLRHFGAGLVAWEDKEGTLTFDLAEESNALRPVFVHRQATPDTGGKTLRLTFEHTPPDALAAWLVIEEGEQRTELDFQYRRTMGSPADGR
ncbi:MAG: DUF6265 family protein [Acidobacteriota bacterium]|nr:DUF6265 family protein [Acidobacteriota bacterium]